MNYDSSEIYYANQSPNIETLIVSFQMIYSQDLFRFSKGYYCFKNVMDLCPPVGH